MIELFIVEQEVNVVVNLFDLVVLFKRKKMKYVKECYLELLVMEKKKVKVEVEVVELFVMQRLLIELKLVKQDYLIVEQRMIRIVIGLLVFVLIFVLKRKGKQLVRFLKKLDDRLEILFKFLIERNDVGVVKFFLEIIFVKVEVIVCEVMFLVFGDGYIKDNGKIQIWDDVFVYLILEGMNNWCVFF